LYNIFVYYIKCQVQSSHKSCFFTFY